MGKWTSGLNGWAGESAFRPHWRESANLKCSGRGVLQLTISNVPQSLILSPVRINRNELEQKRLLFDTAGSNRLLRQHSPEPTNLANFGSQRLTGTDRQNCS